MAFVVLPNYCCFIAAVGGIGSFTVSAALDANHDVPEHCNVTNGKSYHYFAQSGDGTEYETGDGVYSTAAHTLARVVLVNSNDDTNPVDFVDPPIVYVYPSPLTMLDLMGRDFPIPAGTLMLFQQTAAPTGWTKQTTHNDKALRVVSGAASSGGSNTFSTVFAQTQVGNTTLSTTQMPAHTHTESTVSLTAGYGGIANGSQGLMTQTPDTSSTGGGGSHTHPFTMSIEYVDLIIASKD